MNNRLVHSRTAAASAAVFLLPLLACGNQQLAQELFAEGDWNNSRLEAARWYQRTGDPHARLLQRQSEQKLGRDVRADLRVLAHDEDQSGTIRCRAAYLLGQAESQHQNRPAALEAYLRAYHGSTDIELFQRSAAALWHLLQADPTARQDRPALWLQLQSQQTAWPPYILQQAAPPGPKKRRNILTAIPRACIAFYRRQISPAIGNRCSLAPSCSRYAQEALQQYGLMGIPMIADRSIREPDVVHQAHHPVYQHDRRLFSDPLCNHYPFCQH